MKLSKRKEAINLNKKKFAIALLATIMMSACTVGKVEEEDISQQEKEIRAIAEWFSDDIKDEDNFPDLKEYQYYARSIGLDKDKLLSADMWEIYYNEEININRDVDEKAIYLIRLNPNSLLDIYAENNNTTVKKICNELSVTQEQLYYNWGYTAAAVNYTKNHKDNIVTYSEDEVKVFGVDNGENRQTVMSTHMLVIDISRGNTVTYQRTIPELEIRQRDILRSTTKMTYNYSDYSENEKNPALSINGIGIRRVIPLSLPNGWTTAVDKEITVMLNQSPYSYGCTDSDKVHLFKEESEVSE